MLFVDLLDKYAVLFVTTVSPLLCHWNVFFHWRGPWAGQTIERMVLCSFPCFMPVTLFFLFLLYCFCFCFLFYFFQWEREREWCCVVFHSKACLGFAVVILTHDLPVAVRCSINWTNWAAVLYALLWLLISNRETLLRCRLFYFL